MKGSSRFPESSASCVETSMRLTTVGRRRFIRHSGRQRTGRRDFLRPARGPWTGWILILPSRMETVRSTSGRRTRTIDNRLYPCCFVTAVCPLQHPSATHAIRVSAKSHAFHGLCVFISPGPSLRDNPRVGILPLQFIRSVACERNGRGHACVSNPHRLCCPQLQGKLRLATSSGPNRP